MKFLRSNAKDPSHNSWPSQTTGSFDAVWYSQITDRIETETDPFETASLVLSSPNPLHDPSRAVQFNKRWPEQFSNPSSVAPNIGDQLVTKRVSSCLEMSSVKGIFTHHKNRYMVASSRWRATRSGVSLGSLKRAACLASRVRHTDSPIALSESAKPVLIENYRGTDYPKASRAKVHAAAVAASLPQDRGQSRYILGGQRTPEEEEEEEEVWAKKVCYNGVRTGWCKSVQNERQHQDNVFLKATFFSEIIFYKFIGPPTIHPLPTWTDTK